MLKSEDFAVFFQELHGHSPFPWQTRLAETAIIEEKFPASMNLPTGSGKTSMLDIALFAFLCKPEVFPRRIAFVIDRRVIVDQVYTRALRIQAAIAAATGNTPTIFKAKRRLLEEICGDSTNALLGVSPLRGGIAIDGEWHRQPNVPWVLVSTVDQFGSRLLFRGYGVSDGMKPIHAALAGNDCLVILDEMHIARPFAETLRAVQLAEDDNRGGLPPRKFHVIEMSATPTDTDADVFELDEVDRRHRDLSKRLKATKTIKAVKLPSKNAEECIPVCVKKIVAKLPENVQTVGVIVNRVATARATREAIADAVGDNADVHLLTGRMRPLDKEAVVLAAEKYIAAGSENTGTKPVFVVSTQTIEVGADYDFDMLITECAPIDSLKQRAGRLNRRGKQQEAECHVLGGARDHKNGGDFVYGDTLKATWEYLWDLSAEGSADMCGSAESDIWSQSPPECLAETYNAPLLLKSYLNAWNQTRPKPYIDPDVAPFLHGLQSRPSYDVNLVWREDISEQTLKLVPPRPAEYLPVPVYAARAWLADSEKELVVSDMSFIVDEDFVAGKDDFAAIKTEACKWNPHTKKAEIVGKLGAIKPGDVIIVNPARGGIEHGTWQPTSKSSADTERIRDIGDLAQAAYKQRRTLRLDPKLYTWASYISDETSLKEQAEEQLNAATRDTAMSDQEKELVEAFQSNISFTCRKAGTENGEYIVLVENTATGKLKVDISSTDGEDISEIETGSLLNEHMDGVGDIAKCFALSMGMPAEIASDLKFAGRLHDLGKVDNRFQKKMAGGDPVLLSEHRKNETYLAKPAPGADRHADKSYPKGMRHEAASLAMIRRSELLERASDTDLVQHLVASHHGYGRALLPLAEDAAPETLKYKWEDQTLEAKSDLQNTNIAVEHADRFWRLTEKYGYWGLALLEATLRLADHLQSKLETQ